MIHQYKVCVRFSVTDQVIGFYLYDTCCQVGVGPFFDDAVKCLMYGRNRNEVEHQEFTAGDPK